jgi:predicted PurR-regulated permease PerM
MAPVDIMIRLGTLALLFLLCFLILKPFLFVILWGLIIAVALYPVYARVRGWLGGRDKLAATLITAVILLLLLLPAVPLTGSLFNGIDAIRTYIREHGPALPPPPAEVAGWPLIGGWMNETWSLASTNLEGVLTQYAEELKTAASWLFSALTGAGFGLLLTFASIIIAGIFLGSSEKGSRAAYALGERLMGAQGREFVSMAEVTVRNVAVGIVGVAVIQSVLAALGFVMAGVPFAGLWAAACLMLAVMQIGVGPIVLPTIIYLFMVNDTLTATLFTLYFVFVLLVDNILKPILLGRGAPVPMLVVFLGSIGGFIAFGIVGFFVGAVILSLGYRLYLLWLSGSAQETTEPPGESA